MGKLYEGLDGSLRAFIEGQRMFFVATAPMDAAGHVNLSPKGLETPRILSSMKVAYLDHVGSGTETIAHLRENGRIVLAKNSTSIDGLPAITWLQAPESAREPSAG